MSGSCSACFGCVAGCDGAFTQQQVDQDLLSCQSVAPCETHDSANNPRDPVARQRQQGDHGAAASPGGGRVRAHPHAFGQADVNGEEGVYGDSFEGRVQLHAVLLRHLGGLSPVLAAVVGRFLGLLAALVLGLRRSSGAAAALRGSGCGPRGLMVQGYELRSAQDAVPLTHPGSPRVSRGHVCRYGTRNGCKSARGNSSVHSSLSEQ